MKLYLELLLLVIPTVFSWKPIPGPTVFSISQSHPSAQSLISQPTNLLGGSDGSSSETISTYHGNSFFDNDSQNNDDSLYDIPEGRILPGKTPYFHGQIFNPTHPTISSGIGDTCSVDKFAFEHEGTVEYDASIPSLEQFTLCTWMRFTNHSGDHTLFTYSVDDEPREIQLWIANARGASYISMAVHGQSLFRLNYPFRVRQWHHACGSWNGKTGEWQLWIKAERVGRGFHNRLVGFKVRPHGVVFSGGPSATGPTNQNLHTEVTLIQLYKIALSAGKAHRDHKHHHVHHFDHNGPVTSTTAPPTIQPTRPQIVNPLLANGQFPSRVRINVAGAQPEQPPSLPVQGLPSQLVGGLSPQSPFQNQATISTQFVNGQYHTGGRLITQQLLNGNLLQQQASLQAQPGPTTFSFPTGSSSSFSLLQPANVQYLDETQQSKRFLFKRNDKTIKKRETTDDDNDDKKIEKRGLVVLKDGTLIDDSLLGNDPIVFDGLAQFGAPAFKAQLTKMMNNIEDEIKEHDREPAEGEVQAVMSVCSSCDIEPFEGAIVFGWKDLRGRPNGALKAKTIGGCGNF